MRIDDFDKKILKILKTQEDSFNTKEVFDLRKNRKKYLQSILTMVKCELINIMSKMCFIIKIKWINLRKNTNTNVYRIT